MDSENLSKRFFGGIGVKGLKAILSPQRTSNDLKLAINFCSKHDKILDLACGYGRITLLLAKLGYDIQGIDIESKYIKSARSNAKKQKLRVTFAIGNIRKMPYTNEFFDKIICLWSSFNYILLKNEQIQSLNEIFRVLRSGGQAIFEMDNAEKKGLKQLLEIKGKGPGRRLLPQMIRYSQNKYLPEMRYFHDRQTLTKICNASKFKRFKIGLKNLYGERRLILYLYK
ncbi:MAG: class I SAM-dependent methyltransferase [Candidatus Margulisbacteria bacterium]|nr:class I SAM-dependent methyltransferase [Candidatus Margulisiibacteriota bacterium]MBU1022242.1 class I SAM-dependent methyltransferase [Candidatus Margulisiibacteriota bacterium]MBU1729319.1 class I SAM-dependent methyltransferase [Candidatus Margulisiibacteriota bacterium]MBU1955592.1 class I SAM-dependent methyltransferase [Candidatus Margulisiibacteriota bacterium]